jgi:HEAT repeat protein
VREATAHRGAAQKWRRIAALRVLFHGRHAGILRLLERALGDVDPDVVGAAVDLLGSMGDRQAAFLLVGGLRAQVYPPSRIATLLDGFPFPIAELLLPLLDDASPVVRFWAATLLVRYAGTDGLEDRLVFLARDPDPLVRKATVETLGRIGGAKAAATALELLEDPVWYVRAHAARALGDLGRADLADRIMPLLADGEWWVRFAVKESLQAMGAAIVPDLIPYLDHADGFARNGTAEVLQNLGFLDSLAAGVANRPNDAARAALLRKIVSAGGAGLTQALVRRTQSVDPARVARLVERLSPAP